MYKITNRMSDISETKPTEINDYKMIKPKEDLSVGECRFFWDNVFSSEIKIDNVLNENEFEQVNEARIETRVDGKYYFDDNGKLYRVGNELAHNSDYVINGYHYKTNEKGNIVSVEGKLHLKNRDNRLPIKDSIDTIGKGDQYECDDRGHLIGDQFDGSNGLENMVPQNAELNRKEFKNFENELSNCIKDGKDVYIKIEPVFEGGSSRPISIVVTYSIDGEKSVRIFNNYKGADCNG